MAINLNLSVFEHKKDAVLNPAVDAATLERGMVMIRSGFTAAGKAMVSPSTGAGTDVPVGVLMLANTSQAQSQSPLIEKLTVPAAGPYTIVLREIPTATAQIRAYNTDTGATIVVVTGAPGAGQLGIVLATKTLTADAALAAVNFTIVYRFAITAAVLARRAGVRSVNNNNLEGQYLQVTLAYGNCQVYTSLFDTEDTWDLAASVVPLTAASGRISLDGAGVALGQKLQAPTMLLTHGLEQAFVGYTTDLPGA